MNVSVMDYLVGLVIELGDIIIGAVNALWSHVDFTGFYTALRWFAKLNEFLPVQEFFMMLGVLMGLAALSLTIKFGIKCIDWVRG